MDDILGKSIALAGTIINPRRGILNFSAAFNVADNPVTGTTDVGLASSVGAWQTYTPDISAIDPAFVLGNGTVSGRWRMSGPDSIDVAVSLVVGSSTSFGAGDINVSIPAGWAVDTGKMPGGFVALSSVYLRDSGTPANNRAGRVVSASGSRFKLNPTGTDSNVSAAVPFTWATGDTLLVGVTLPVSVDI